MTRRIQGIHIQWPWSQFIISGLKVVETRSYPLPQKYLGIELAIIETPGPRGKRDAQIASARIIGTVTFTKCFRYETKDEWINDLSRHLVPIDNNHFSWNPSKEKWGWEIKAISKITNPVPPPKKRGIIFAANCRVPEAAL